MLKSYLTKLTERKTAIILQSIAANGISASANAARLRSHDDEFCARTSVNVVDFHCPLGLNGQPHGDATASDSDVESTLKKINYSSTEGAMFIAMERRYDIEFDTLQWQLRANASLLFILNAPSSGIKYRTEDIGPTVNLAAANSSMDGIRTILGDGAYYSYELKTDEAFAVSDILAILVPRPLREQVRAIFPNTQVIAVDTVKEELKLSPSKDSHTSHLRKIDVPDYVGTLRSFVRNNGLTRFTTHATRLPVPEDFIHLYSHEVSINVLLSTYNATDLGKALRGASANGCDDDLRFLLAQGAPIDEQSPMTSNNGGRTALHWSIVRKHEDCIFSLIKTGASHTIKDKFGKTPRDYAAEAGIDLNAIFNREEQFENQTAAADLRHALSGSATSGFMARFAETLGRLAGDDSFQHSIMEQAVSMIPACFWCVPTRNKKQDGNNLLSQLRQHGSSWTKSPLIFNPSAYPDHH